MPVITLELLITPNTMIHHCIKYNSSHCLQIKIVVSEHVKIINIPVVDGLTNQFSPLRKWDDLFVSWLDWGCQPWRKEALGERNLIPSHPLRALGAGKHPDLDGCPECDGGHPDGENAIRHCAVATTCNTYERRQRDRHHVTWVDTVTQQ